MKSAMLYFALALLFLSSCSAKWAKQLSVHQNQLSKTASSNILATQKLDTLLTSFAEMMHQSLDRLNPKTGVKYVESYAETNQESILAILAEVKEESKKMEKSERLSLGIGLLTKPYARSFKELLPRFQKKYAQYKLASSLSKKIKVDLADIAGNVLGL